MLRSLLITVLAGLVALVAADARAQLVAFPGAEGAAKFASGGRGTLGNPGDVYIVTTLEDYDPDNDSGHPNDVAETPIVGSLRHGILTAPASGRTIVFAVDGTIELHDLLDFKGKDNITIAGQTAPGGGITIAKHETRINNASNVILQHVRFRPGDRLPASFTPAQFPSYDQDALGITDSTDVMIDHVTASWSVDEGISPTSNSNRVTIQWSTITQALNSAGHSEMDPSHSFGSLVNGGNYTFHHNLYAHNRSRNPRPQSDSLRLDFVNNVIHNPGIRYGNSENNTDLGEGYELNFVGNYGIDGPNTTAPALFQAANTPQSLIYASGNYRDSNDNGTLDGGPNSALAGGYTPLASRVDLPQVDTTDAPQAYVQVLSRAGANFHRDPVDRQMIRSVFNQLGGFLNSQSQVGGWPTLPAGTPAPDSNSDGVPDAWAIQNGFNISTPLNTVFAPEGYSYLEKFVHSLTPYSYAPTSTISHTIPTGFGSGADAFVNENGGGSATSSGDGTGNTLDVGWDGAGGLTNQAMVLKFDLSQLVPGSLTSARLDLTAAPGFTGNHTFKVYGLEHDQAGWDWDDTSVEFNGSPGLAFDGNSGTLGINPTYSAGSPVDTPGVLALGTLTANGLTDGQTVSFANLNLAVFLNLAAYFEGASQDGLVTLIIEQTNDAGAALASFHSSEGNALLAPRLVVDALLAPIIEPPLAGDYNGDDVVDAADYTVWRDALDSDTPLLNETASLGTVDAADYDAWKANFGAVPAAGAGSASVAVPEPATLLIVWVGLLTVGAASRWERSRGA